MLEVQDFPREDQGVGRVRGLPADVGMEDREVKAGLGRVRKPGEKARGLLAPRIARAMHMDGLAPERQRRCRR